MTKRTVTEIERAQALAKFGVLSESSLSGETFDPIAAAMRDKYVGDMLAPESFVSRHIERHAPGFLVTYTALTELPEFEHIARQAVVADRSARTEYDGNGPWVIFTTRPGERYTLTDDTTFEAALRIAQHDIACDLDMGRNGYCVSELEMIKRHKLTYSPKVGRFLNQAFTFPLMYEECVVLSRICFECWIKFVKQNKIKPASIHNPWEVWH